jgi:hypothetical protein
MRAVDKTEIAQQQADRVVPVIETILLKKIELSLRNETNQY